jgi:hypothetical protein
MHGWFHSFLGGGAFFLVAEDEEASASVFLNGQHPVIVAVEGGGGCSGSGRGRGSASYKERGHGFPRAIDGGSELEAVVASGTTPLMVA